jgi:hypothetical protein
LFSGRDILWDFEHDHLGEGLQKEGEQREEEKHYQLTHS